MCVWVGLCVCMCLWVCVHECVYVHVCGVGVEGVCVEGRVLWEESVTGG